MKEYECQFCTRLVGPEVGGEEQSQMAF